MDASAHQHVAEQADPETLVTFLRHLFDNDFIQRTHCYMERPSVIWLHLISDALIMASYYSIPFGLVYLVHRRRDIGYHWMLVMFAAFIFACGTTHLFNIQALWYPVYRLDGVIKAITAGLSVATAIALWKIMPTLIMIPSPSQLTQANKDLHKEIEDRREAQQQLRVARDELEVRVKERTNELEETNRGLQEQIVQRQAAEHRRNLMIAELDHRVKNNLAAVIAIMQQTMRSAATLPEFTDSFAGRVRAMATTHEALARGKWEGIPLNDLIARTLGHYGGADGSRLRFSGPQVSLPARAALPLSMALHELATNAAKYGSLAVSDGYVQIAWTLRDDDELELTWTERGGKPVTRPTRTGLGTQLVQGLIGYELQGTVAFDYPPEGVTCKMSMNLKDQTENQQLATPHPGEAV